MARKFIGSKLNLAVLILLSLALAACGDSTASRDSFPTPSPNPVAGQITGPAPGLVEGAKINFPEDEAPHNNITEWWYYTGHFTTDDGAQYGFEYVIFQVVRAEFPPGYFSHFTVTDLNRKTFKFDQRVSLSREKGVFGGNAGFKVAVNDWTMQGLAGTDRLKAKMTDGSYGIDFSLHDLKGPVLHGGGRFSYGAAGLSYYYSRPRMAVLGTLNLAGQTRTVKEGVAWFDHQWGDFVPVSLGWDWFSLHLADNTELMIYYLRDDKNNVLDIFGSYVPACAGPCNSVGTGIARSVNLRREDFIIKAAGYWTSPVSGGIYPSGWNVQVVAKNVPALNLNLKPLLKNQELDASQATFVTYWEGACEVSGTKDGQPLSGQAYVELTGYAKNKS